VRLRGEFVQGFSAVGIHAVFVVDHILIYGIVAKGFEPEEKALVFSLSPLAGRVSKTGTTEAV
jgi:hypothetical protein